MNTEVTDITQASRLKTLNICLSLHFLPPIPSWPRFLSFPNSTPPPPTPFLALRVSCFQETGDYFTQKALVVHPAVGLALVDYG